MKNHKGLVPSLIAVIVLLSLTLLVSIIYNFIGGFYLSRMSEFNKVLGEEQIIKLETAGAYVSSFNLAGTLVLGGDIKQKIVISNGENVLYLRAKVSLCEKDMCGKMFGYTNWVDVGDGYIYLNESIKEYETIGLCEYVKFYENELQLESNLNYIVNFIVEASNIPYKNLVL